PAHHRVELARGRHFIQFEGVMLGKAWRIVPKWNGASLGSILFPVATLGPTSRVDRVARPAGNWLLAVLVAGLVPWWSFSAARRVHSSAMLIWSAAASLAIVIVTTFL